MSLTGVQNRIVIVPQVHATRRMRGVYIEATGHIIVDTINADGESEIVELDYSTVLFDEDERTFITGATADFVRRVYADGALYNGFDNVMHFSLDWYHAAGSAPSLTQHTVTPEHGETFPQYAFWGTQAQEKPTRTVYYGEVLTYPEKQARAVQAMIDWRKQKRAWMNELQQRSDLGQVVVEHGGYWLRAADRALQWEFQNPSVDPLVVTKMAQLAILGATDIDTVDKFAIGLNQIRETYNDGPTAPTLWIQRGADGQNVEDVYRTTLGGSHDYTDLLVTMPEDYNPIASDWVLPNQLGLVTVDNLTPSAGDTVTATATDPDGIVGAATYQWKKFVTDDFVDIQGATAVAYTIPNDAAVGDEFQCVASYTDNYGPNQEALSFIIVVQ